MKFPLKRVFSVHQEAGSGGGGGYTFTGGLTETAGTVVFGGSLSSNTILSGLNLRSLQFSGLTSFTVTTNGAFNITAQSGVVINSYLARYNTDLSAGYTDRAIPDWGNVISQLGGNALDSTVISPGATQSNGLLSWNNGNQEFEFASDVTLGAGKTGSTRTIDANGSEANVSLIVTTKGIGGFLVRSTGAAFNNYLYADDNYLSPASRIRLDAQNNEIVLTSLATSQKNYTIRGSNGIPAFTNGGNLTLRPGDAFNTGDNDGGTLYLRGGLSNGSGIPGAVAIKQTFKTISTTTYTILESDWGKRLIFTNAAGCTVTLPDGLSDGLEAAAKRATGAGVVSFAADTTLLSSGTQITTEEDWASVVHEGSDVWHAAGLN